MTILISYDTSQKLVFVCRVAIALTGLLWLYQGFGLELGVAIGSLVLTFVPGLLFRDPPLRDATSAVTALLVAAHIVFGMLGALYETSLLYDKAMHLLGSGAIAALLLLAAQRYCHRHRITVPLTLLAAIVIGGTLSAGTLWELFEFAIDQTGLFQAQRGLHDTMFDLLADAGGGVLLFMLLLNTDAFDIRNDY